MKILAIGNSFSEDAMYYLKNIADADGVEVKAVNLYIGGCNLERHWKNIRTDAREYQYQLNGHPQDRMVSVKEALDEEEWDYVFKYGKIPGELIDYIGTDKFNACLVYTSPSPRDAQL